MSLTITITGNHLDCFTAAELSLVSTDTEIQIGRVFERPDGWKCELFANAAPRVLPLDELVSHLQMAKEALVPYVNRTGVNPPSGLTPVTLSLWLMTKADGTAMGMKVEW